MCRKRRSILHLRRHLMWRGGHQRRRSHLRHSVRIDLPVSLGLIMRLSLSLSLRAWLHLLLCCEFLCGRWRGYRGLRRRIGLRGQLRHGRRRLRRETVRLRHLRRYRLLTKPLRRWSPW